MEIKRLLNLSNQLQLNGTNPSNSQEMDLFFLCWSFDSRWLFRIKNPCYELIFTVPLIINVGVLGWAFIQKSIHSDNHLPFFIQVIIVQALLSISNFYVIYVIRTNTAEKMTKIKDNYVVIEKFYHDYETKKAVWSFIGLIMTFLAIVSTLIQKLYINRNQAVYNCYANQFRYYLDIIAYSYILLNIAAFIILKLVYLFFAWVCCPSVYLKLKKIID